MPGSSSQTVSCESERHNVFWGKTEEAHQLAAQCREQWERRTGKPYVVGFFKGVDNLKGSVGPFYFVTMWSQCADGAVFDGYDSAIEAKKCVEALARVMAFNSATTVSTSSVSRFLRPDVYTVHLKKQ